MLPLRQARPSISAAVSIATAWLRRHGKIVPAPLPDGIDGETRAFIEGSRRIAEVCDSDSSPAAQGMWKAFERESNLSVVQAARKSRGAHLPAYFALYDPDFPHERSVVVTRSRGSRTETVDLNKPERGPELKGRHRFLTLGEAWHVKGALSHNPAESFDGVVRECIQEWPVEFDSTWERIIELRNKGSHTDVLSEAEFREVVTLLERRSVLPRLVSLKARLRSVEGSPWTV